MQVFTIFEEIDGDLAREISRISTVKSFAAGEVIFEKDRGADCLYLLESGQVDLLMSPAEDARFKVNRTGDVFGWSALVENGVYTVTATCETDARVHCIPKDQMDAILNKNVGTAVELFRKIGDKFPKQIAGMVES